jgi:acetoacetyl-[acyl-carrier protein] synthase
MTRIPIITGFGGINPAGRSSQHHGYRRMVIDALSGRDMEDTYTSLARLMGVAMEGRSFSPAQKAYMRDHTLIRRIEPEWFNVDQVPLNRRAVISAGDGAVQFVSPRRYLPDPIPEGWQIDDIDDRNVRVTLRGENDFLLPVTEEFSVKAAGQLPSGFEPGKLYPARSHPRGLQMSIYAMSDALGNLGIDWDFLRTRIAPDELAVYASSAMGQLDEDGNSGLLGARYRGKRVTSKHLPFGLVDMPADFVNAYVLGNLGSTSAGVGACATFLYNLRLGIQDIQSGRARVVIVGGSEAPIIPDVMEGYIAMGALATDKELLELDALKGLTTPDWRRAARPFSDNCGFTIAEAAQYIVLMDDELALELGATIYGAVTDVFVNADGYKKSISSPGVGNYLTVAKAVAAARAIVGDESIQRRSFIHAHGTSTPQNRVTESHILNETAKTFGIEKWPVAAIKAYVGHTLSCAGGDQIINALGTWAYGIVPGIKTIEYVASDVHQSHLRLSSEHLQANKTDFDCAFVNAKGFGGNNATGTLLAPHIVEKMLAKKHGASVMNQWRTNNEAVRQAADAYEQRALAGTTEPVYRFDYGVLGGESLTMSDKNIQVPGFEKPVNLEFKSPYSGLLD